MEIDDDPYGEKRMNRTLGIVTLVILALCVLKLMYGAISF